MPGQIIDARTSLRGDVHRILLSRRAGPIWPDNRRVALVTQIYPGFYPGVYRYSDRSNTATFQWYGTTSTVSTGIVYLPNSPLAMGGSSNGKMWRGQLIADRFQFDGNTDTEIEYSEYVPMQTPVVALVE